MPFSVMCQNRTPCPCLRQGKKPSFLGLEFLRLSLLVGKDIRVTSIEDGHGGAAEELAAGGTKLDL